VGNKPKREGIGSPGRIPFLGRVRSPYGWEEEDGRCPVGPTRQRGKEWGPLVRERRGEGRRGWAGATLGRAASWAARGEKGEGVLGRDGEKEKVRFCLFFFFFNQKPTSNPFKICLNHFQTLVKITHLRNKMHQHVLHPIVAKPYDKFCFKEKYYSFYIFMSTKSIS